MIPSEYGGTLAPGQQATVTVSAAATMATQVAGPTGQFSVWALFASDGGSTSADAGAGSQLVTIPVQQFADGCFIQNPPGPANFGNVAVNSVATATVGSPVESCYLQAEYGAPELIGGAAPFRVVSNNGAPWTIAFAPTSAGVQSSTFSFVMIVGTGPVCDPQDLSFVVTGTGSPRAPPRVGPPPPLPLAAHDDFSRALSNERRVGRNAEPSGRSRAPATESDIETLQGREVLDGICDESLEGGRAIAIVQHFAANGI